MLKIKVSLTVNQTPGIIAEALNDPGNMVKCTADLERFELIEGKPGEAGAVAHLHYRERGREYVMEDRLEYCAPGKKYVSRVSGNGMSARVETILTPTEEGTEITVFWSGTNSSPVARIILPFMRPVIKRRALADLEAFKKLVEGQLEETAG
ncbi:MAG: SRPBCC family protein [Actinobacteria bacterium]|nr:SRPBCC family protein [Actinomycetota bacterium]